jgi:hypothetical protein
MYDVKPDRVGWTVYDAGTGRAALLDGAVLQALDHAAADEFAGLLNGTVYGPRSKRAIARPDPLPAVRRDAGRAPARR